MKNSHIQYMQSLCSAVTLNGRNPFAGERFYEIDPPLDAYQKKVPIVVCRHVNVSTKRTGRRNQRLPRKGTSVRFVKQLYSQLHAYRLEFWLRDPADDILSNTEMPGIIDQALVYMHQHRIITDETGASIRVEAEQSGVVKDPDQDTGLYYVFIALSFFDGLHKIEKVKTLSGSQVKITNQGDV